MTKHYIFLINYLESYICKYYFTSKSEIYLEIWGILLVQKIVHNVHYRYYLDRNYVISIFIDITM